MQYLSVFRVTQAELGTYLLTDVYIYIYVYRYHAHMGRYCAYHWMYGLGGTYPEKAGMFTRSVEERLVSWVKPSWRLWGQVFRQAVDKKIDTLRALCLTKDCPIKHSVNFRGSIN